MLVAGTFMDFFRVIEALRIRHTPENLPFNVIVPSLPGFAFSSPPPYHKDCTVEDVARLMNKLVLLLNSKTKYIAHGSDIGGRVALTMAAEYSECQGELAAQVGKSFAGH